MSAYRTQIPLLTHEEKEKWMSMLTALRQAIIGTIFDWCTEGLTNFWRSTEHGKMFRDGGKVHGNVCPQAIGNKNGIGCLLDPNDLPFNPAFQSIMRLNTINFGNDSKVGKAHKLKTLPTSYVDELESFFFTIAYLCMRYSRAVPDHGNFSDPKWISDPLSYAAIMEKERISDNGILAWSHSRGEAVLFTGFFKDLVACLIKAREADRMFQMHEDVLKRGKQAFHLEDCRTSSRSSEDQRKDDVISAYAGFIRGIDDVLSRITQL
jgi:hypothetical protein